MIQLTLAKCILYDGEDSSLLLLPEILIIDKISEVTFTHTLPLPLWCDIYKLNLDRGMLWKHLG